MADHSPRKLTLPKTLRALRAWLKGSADGKDLLERTATTLSEEKCRSCPLVRPSLKVLVVLRRIGLYPGVEVYSQKGTVVRIFEMPDLPDGATFDLVTEDWLKARLSRSWRTMLEDAEGMNHVEVGVFRGLSVDDVWRAEEALWLIRKFKEAVQ